MYGQDRGELREIFFRAWEDHRQGRALEGIAQLIVRIAAQHPEYHPLLEHPERYRDRDYLPEAGEGNPFLHLGMHIAIEEQLSIDQPRGIRFHYQRLVQQAGDEHAAQHIVMECLGEMIWQAQRNGTAPDESLYLNCLARHGGLPPRPG